MAHGGIINMKSTNLQDLINNLNMEVSAENKRIKEQEEAHKKKHSTAISEITRVIDTLNKHEIGNRVANLVLDVDNGLPQHKVIEAIAEANYLATVVRQLGGIIEAVVDEDGEIVKGHFVTMAVEEHLVQGNKRMIFKIGFHTENYLQFKAFSCDPTEDGNSVELCTYNYQGERLSMKTRVTSALNPKIASILYEASELSMYEISGRLADVMDYLNYEDYAQAVTVQGLDFEGDVSYEISVPLLLEVLEKLKNGEDVRSKDFCTTCLSTEPCTGCKSLAEELDELGEEDDEESYCVECGDYVPFGDDLCEDCYEDQLEEEEEEPECDCLFCNPGKVKELEKRAKEYEEEVNREDETEEEEVDSKLDAIDKFFAKLEDDVDSGKGISNEDSFKLFMLSLLASNKK